jgi:hypothetical protein
MSLSPSGAVKDPLRCYRSVGLLFTLVALLFCCASISSAATAPLSSSLKELQSRFHTNGVVPPVPHCPPLELIVLNVEACVSLDVLNLIRLDVALEADVFEYTIIRPAGVNVLKLLAVADIDVIVNVYLNGVIVSPHPCPPGVVLDLHLVAGVNVIGIDLIKDGCIKHYTCTVH